VWLCGRMGRVQAFLVFFFFDSVSEMGGVLTPKNGAKFGYRGCFLEILPLIFYYISLDVDTDTNYRVIPVWPGYILMLSAKASHFILHHLFIVLHIYRPYSRCLLQRIPRLLDS
jgi:hypothetical protein